jgi:hypothetical protein
MAVGLFGPHWFVRLPEAQAAPLIAAGAGPFEPVTGHPMTGYWVLPDAILEDDAQLRRWVELSFDYVRTLPPKEPGRKKK